ncbi:MAG: nucleotidyltransferase family protein, partial [Acidimicrobiales bacterium]
MKPSPSHDWIASVAGFGLPGAPAFPASPLGSGDWGALLAGVVRERIEGLLAASVAAGALPVEEGQREQVRQAARGRARVDIGLERELLGTAALLDGAGVAYRALKGPAWAHTLYSDPSWRGFGDVDLLLDGRDWYRAVE